MSASTKIQNLFLLVPFVLGAAMAVTYVDTNAGPQSEPSFAAMTLLREGTIGDPYGFPTGPTAHVSPLHVGWLAATYWLFGVYTPAARIVLSIFNLLCYVGGCACALGVCRRLCHTRSAVWFLIVLICLLSVPPIYHAIILYRTWDQTFGALVLMLGAYLFVRLRDMPDRTHQLTLGLGILSGIGGLSCPATLPPLFLLTLMQASSKRSWRARAVCVGFWFFVTALCVLPWGIRNQIVLGEFIPFRSNFALEFQVGIQDGATGMTGVYDSGDGLKWHPYRSIPNTRRMAMIGEVAYMHTLGSIASNWVAAHPWQFAMLSIRRIWLSLIPTRQITDWAPLAESNWHIVRGMIGALEIGSFALMVMARRELMFWITISMVPLAPYFFTHTNIRYTSISYLASLCVVAAGLDIVLTSGVCTSLWKRSS
jgi:hypothetical protein